MDWTPFHHPDWSLPVVKRRISEEWIDMMKDVGELMRVNERRFDWNHSYPSQTAYQSAMSRLKNAGLVAKHNDDGKLPLLKITPQALDKLPVYHRPRTLWDTKWNGIWYTLIFDVPEKERHYRDTLRGFLKRLRMGMLQKSVWVTPRDIRPDYDDLQQAANIHAISFLFESRTVLHRETSEIVENSWGFDRLYELQERYVSTYEKNLQRLSTGNCEASHIMTLLYQEAEAYIQCMRPDPLLPSELLPRDYLGKNVFKLHEKTRKQIAEALISLASNTHDRGS